MRDTESDTGYCMEKLNACGTLAHAWNCFHGIGGNPISTGCSDNGYN